MRSTWLACCLLGLSPTAWACADEQFEANSGENAAVLRSLEQHFAAQSFNGTLEGLLQELRSLSIPVWLDRKALESVAVDPRAPLAIDLRHARLRPALDLALRDLDLTWLVRDGVLIVTTAEQAEQSLTTRVYDVRDLVAVEQFEGRAYPDFDWLLEVLESTIAPVSWSNVGGPAYAQPFFNERAVALVVSQTDQNHTEIEQLLRQLRQLPGQRSQSASPSAAAVAGPPLHEPATRPARRAARRYAAAPPWVHRAVEP